MEDQPPILRLNEYCLLEIFSYFNLYEVLTLEKVCPQFKNIAESFYRAQLKWFDFSFSNIRDLKRIALKIGPYLETLKIYSDSQYNNHFEITIYFLTQCTNLRHLEIHICDIMKLMKVFPLQRIFKSLETLKLNHCELTDEIGPCLKAATHLKSLSLMTSCFSAITCSFLKDIKYLEHLEKLTLSLPASFSKANFLEFCEENLTLKSLRIYAHNEFKDGECFQAITNGLRNLESFDLTGWCNIPGRNILDFLTDLPKLKCLRLDSADGPNFSSSLQSFSTRLESLTITDRITKDDIESITKFEKLKELKLYGIDDEMLKTLTEKLRCKNVLEDFEIRCSLVSNEAIYDFVNKCPQLKNLDLSNCQDITKDLIIRLVPVLNKRPQKILIRLTWCRWIRSERSTDQLLKSLGNSKIIMKQKWSEEEYEF